MTAPLPPVVLVRHGRTAWNRTRFLGRRDVPLDEVGRGQAAAAADAVRTLLGPVGGAVTLWSSPLGRARETAAPVAARLGVPVHLHDDLVELDCGEWEGREKAEVGRKVSKLPPDEPVPGGESAADAWRRLQRFLADAGLGPAGPGAPAAPGAVVDGPVVDGPVVVVVGHHLVNKLLYAALLGRGVEGALATPEYRPTPGSVVLLDRLSGGLRTAPAAVPVVGA
ncbi:histidine phosphatase family protein [Kineosporia sp. A_224]|uniref:histidine phosphatase family protein n=1 Tax=Kineosporia sp. A_224 TaxID=1962180 RepID=UPI0013042F0F|nr:histidine phosphatase family protein [Kineosporia sp. A_224]